MASVQGAVTENSRMKSWLKLTSDPVVINIAHGVCVFCVWHFVLEQAQISQEYQRWPAGSKQQQKQAHLNHLLVIKLFTGRPA